MIPTVCAITDKDVGSAQQPIRVTLTFSCGNAYSGFAPTESDALLKALAQHVHMPSFKRTIIYHQFDDQTHGITVDKMADGDFIVTIYQGDVQTHHILTGNEIADMTSVIDNNNIAD